MNDGHKFDETIPIVEETLSIEKRVVETGRVRVKTLIDEEQLCSARR